MNTKLTKYHIALNCYRYLFINNGKPCNNLIKVLLIFTILTVLPTIAIGKEVPIKDPSFVDKEVYGINMTIPE